MNLGSRALLLCTIYTFRRKFEGRRMKGEMIERKYSLYV